MPPETNKNIEQYIQKTIEALGEDSQRAGLLKTPARAAKALAFLTEGYQKEKDVINDCKNALFKEDVHSAIAVNNIEFYSLCEHHLLPFWGTVSIAFIPNKNGVILGLSKFGRIVDVFSRRLQVQERLGAKLLEVISRILKPQAICIKTEAKHLCMMMRGVEKHSSSTLTYEFKGKKDLEIGLKELLK